MLYRVTMDVEVEADSEDAAVLLAADSGDVSVELLETQPA